MAEFNIRPSQLGAMLRRHEEERQQRIVDALYEAAVEGAALLRSLLPRDLGPLQDSVKAVRAADGAWIVIEAPYAASIEAGSRPHWVPLEVLVEWVKRHAQLFVLLDEVQVDGKSFSSVRARARRMLGPVGIIRVAKAIQVKIAREGTPPRWIVRGSLDRLQEIVSSKVEAKLALPLRG